MTPIVQWAIKLVQWAMGYRAMGDATIVQWAMNYRAMGDRGFL
jgi:hypothetical protein